jgi:hypothetical protein
MARSVAVVGGKDELYPYRSNYASFYVCILFYYQYVFLYFYSKDPHLIPFNKKKHMALFKTRVRQVIPYQTYIPLKTTKKLLTQISIPT